MKSYVAAIAAFGALAGTAHATDAGTTPRVFKPAGNWTADYGEDYCRLERNFSNGTDQLSLAMDRIQPGVGTRMILVGDTVKLYRRAVTVGFRFLPSGGDRMGQLLRSETPGGSQYLLITPVFMAAPPKPGAPPPPTYDRAKEQDFAGTIDGILLTDGTIDPIEIDTGNLKPVIGALQACTDDLLKYWGLDVEKHRTEKRPVLPDGDTSKWLPQGTIPFSDFAKLSGGVNMIRLMVDATGKPTDCKIHFPSLDETTNKKICDSLLENAHFLPALDADGNPFASYYTTPPLFGPKFGGGKRR